MNTTFACGSAHTGVGWFSLMIAQGAGGIACYAFLEARLLHQNAENIISGRGTADVSHTYE